MNKLQFFAISLLSCLVFVSCSKTKKVAKPLKNKSVSYILKNFEKQKLEYTWVGMKVSADITKGEELSESFSSNVKMRKDSAIWISISPALGVEVFRILATPDSVKLLSKIPKNKYYSLGKTDMLSEVAGTTMDFSSLQDILLGNGLELDGDDQKFRSKVDGQQYVLLSKYNRKVNKVVGAKDKDLSPDDTLSIVEGKKYDRIIKKTEEEELLVKRYWFNGESFDLEKLVINDLFNNREITVEYSDFKTIGEQSYPSRVRFNVKDPKENFELVFKISRIKLDKEYELPFEIPENFEEKKF